MALTMIVVVVRTKSVKLVRSSDEGDNDSISSDDGSFGLDEVREGGEIY